MIILADAGCHWWLKICRIFWPFDIQPRTCLLGIFQVRLTSHSWMNVWWAPVSPGYYQCSNTVVHKDVPEIKFNWCITTISLTYTSCLLYQLYCLLLFQFLLQCILLCVLVWGVSKGVNLLCLLVRVKLALLARGSSVCATTRTGAATGSPAATYRCSSTLIGLCLLGCRSSCRWNGAVAIFGMILLVLIDSSHNTLQLFNLLTEIFNLTAVASFFTVHQVIIPAFIISFLLCFLSSLVQSCCLECCTAVLCWNRFNARVIIVFTMPTMLRLTVLKAVPVNVPVKLAKCLPVLMHFLMVSIICWIHSSFGDISVIFTGFY